MRKINWHEVSVFTLRLIMRFVLVTDFALIILYGFFRDSKVLDYMQSEEAPAGVFWFVVVTFIVGFISGLIFFVVNLFYALRQKDEEIEKLQKENAKLRRILTKYSKKHAISPAARILGEISPIGSIDDIQPRSDENEDLDIKPLQQMLKEKASAEKQ